jgi:hypothetical protein
LKKLRNCSVLYETSNKGYNYKDTNAKENEWVKVAAVTCEYELLQYLRIVC